MKCHEVFLLIMQNLNTHDIEVFAYGTYDRLIEEFDKCYNYDVASGRDIKDYIRWPEKYVLTYTTDDAWRIEGAGTTIC